MAEELFESKQAEAAQASAVAEEARLNAMHERIMLSVKEAVRAEMSPDKGRYIDISRVPLICQSLIGINEKLDQMVTQDQFWPVKTLVYGFVIIVLVAVVGALVLSVIPHGVIALP